MADNPWNLTDNEAAVMRALTMTGSSKAVAVDLAVDIRRVENMLYRIYRKMHKPGRILAVLEWDRWARTQEAGK